MKRALCIGISRFADCYTSPLAGGANDAVLLASMLQQHFGFKPSALRLLTDESATTSAITAGLEWLTVGTAPGDVLVFTLATHGTRTIDHNAPLGPAGEVGGNKRIFLAYDSSVSNNLLRDDVAAMLDKIPVGVICYCIIDACDIGPFYNANRLNTSEENRRAVRSQLNVYISRNDNQGRKNSGSEQYDATHRVELTSCAAREESFDLPDATPPQGLFTHSLYKTLEQNSWDMTVSDVYDEVSARVITLADSMGEKQTPQLRAPRCLMNKKIFR